MNNKINDETVIYVKIPRARIKFASKEAETIFDLSLENDWLEQEKQTLKEQLEGVREERDYLFNKLSLQNKYLAEENQELKKQLEKKQNPLQGIFSQVNDDMLLRDCGAMQFEIDEYKTQQKEFIKWLEAMSIMYENEYKDIDAAGHYNCILQKYKSIIGGNKDEK